MSDGFELLMTQHRDVETLFARFEETGDEAIAREICDMLTTHAEMEEQVLYPALRRMVDGGDDLADVAEAEHGAAKTTIARVHDSPPESLAPLMQELRAAVDRHVRSEERELFPIMAESGIEPEQLGHDLVAAQAEAPSRSSGQIG
jgi:iron-sulfur cluster repair protein YtfE (RIC family)